ncbi:MAG TPA: hypothetical protein VKB45_09390 [Gemmatimonadales bacterium]|nr:hypothetical protein [Gemmatimonadales bacterium]
MASVTVLLFTGPETVTVQPTSGAHVASFQTFPSIDTDPGGGGGGWVGVVSGGGGGGGGGSPVLPADGATGEQPVRDRPSGSGFRSRDQDCGERFASATAHCAGSLTAAEPL